MGARAGTAPPPQSSPQPRRPDMYPPLTTTPSQLDQQPRTKLHPATSGGGGDAAGGVEGFGVGQVRIAPFGEVGVAEAGVAERVTGAGVVFCDPPVAGAGEVVQ